MAKKTNKLGTLKELRAADMSTVLDKRTLELNKAKNYRDMSPRLRRLATIRALHEHESHAALHDRLVARTGDKDASLSKAPLATLEEMLRELLAAKRPAVPESERGAEKTEG